MAQLRRELEADPELLGLRLVRYNIIIMYNIYSDISLSYIMVRVETVVCQNQCSGHGDCDQETRLCRYTQVVV